MVLAVSAEWLTAIGTAFGSVATTGAVVVALAARRARMNIRCSRTTLVSEGAEEDGVAVTATNTGGRAVKVTMVALLRRDATLLVTPVPHPVCSALPVLLSEGEAVEWFVPDAPRQLGFDRQQLDSVLAALVTDSAGRGYYGRGPDCGRGPLWWHVRRARVKARHSARRAVKGDSRGPRFPFRG